MVGQDEDQLQEPEKETLIRLKAELLSINHMYELMMVSAKETERSDTLYLWTLGFVSSTQVDLIIRLCATAALNRLRVANNLEPLMADV